MTKRSGKFYFKNEKEVMRRFGFEPTKGSGSGWVEKEDGSNDKAIAQLKSTDKNSFKLDLYDIETLEYHAQVEHKLPIFLIEFMKSKAVYAVVNVSDMKNLDKMLKDESIDFETVVVSKVENKRLRNKKIKSSASDREKIIKEQDEKWQNRRRK